MSNIRVWSLSLLCTLLMQPPAQGGWIKKGVELGVVVDVVTLSALGLAAKKAVDLVNNPSYSQQIAAIARGMSHHLVLGRPTVLAALNEVVKINPAKRDAANQVAADLGLLSRPPGDCDLSRHRFLQDNVDAACQPFPSRCTRADMCAVVSEKMSRFTACADARQQINTECFRGGDKGASDSLYGRPAGGRYLRGNDNVMPLTSRADLAALLVAQFPERPVPARILIDEDAGMDIQQDIGSAFLGKPWTHVTLDDWRMLGTPIAVCKVYMRPDSFAYYVVSILHGSLATDGEFALALEAILPSNQRHVPKGAWWTTFFETFTAIQRIAILAYLQLLKADPDTDDEICSLVSTAQHLYRGS